MWAKSAVDGATLQAFAVVCRECGRLRPVTEGGYVLPCSSCGNNGAPASWTGAVPGGNN